MTLSMERTAWQLRAVSYWRQHSGSAQMPRDQRICQRCSRSEVDDKAHMIFQCSALSGQRRWHAQPFPPQLNSIRSFMRGDPTAVAACTDECCKADKEMKTSQAAVVCMLKCSASA